MKRIAVKNFTPNISPVRFEEAIQAILDKEGNFGRHRLVMSKRIKEAAKSTFYETFLAVCEHYQIRFKGTRNETNSEYPFRVTVYHRGMDWYSFSYWNANQDASKELAEKVYDLLVIQIKNELFFEDRKGDEKHER